MFNLSSNLHRVMRSDPFTAALTGSIGASITALDNRTDNFIAQLDIDTATWALEVYEKEYGIVTDRNKPLDERRSVVKSKMRGGGSLSAAQIKIVADSFTNGDVAVSLNNGILIEFTSVIGTPPNMDDLKTALELIKPAHLPISYKYRYLRIQDVHNVMSIDTLQNTKISDFGGGVDGN